MVDKQTSMEEKKHIIVMKFGGSSVADEQGRASAIARIIAEHKQGAELVVVVSAMGRRGDPYATDTLMSLVCDGGCSAHETDIIMAAGEMISAVVLSSELKKAGIDAQALTGADAGIITDSKSGNATIKHIDVAAIKSVLASGCVAVVAGFQGCTGCGKAAGTFKESIGKTDS